MLQSIAALVFYGTAPARKVTSAASLTGSIICHRELHVLTSINDTVAQMKLHSHYHEAQLFD